MNRLAGFTLACLAAAGPLWAEGSSDEQEAPPPVAEPRLDLPVQVPEFLMVRLRTRVQDRPRRGTAVDVYLRRDREVVGIGREI